MKRADIIKYNCIDKTKKKIYKCIKACPNLYIWNKIDLESWTKIEDGLSIIERQIKLHFICKLNIRRKL